MNHWFFLYNMYYPSIILNSIATILKKINGTRKRTFSFRKHGNRNNDVEAYFWQQFGLIVLGSILVILQ